GLPRSRPFTVIRVIPPWPSWIETAPALVNDRPSPARSVKLIGVAEPARTVTRTSFVARRATVTLGGATGIEAWAWVRLSDLGVLFDLDNRPAAASTASTRAATPIRKVQLGWWRTAAGTCGCGTCGVPTGE